MSEKYTSLQHHQTTYIKEDITVLTDSKETGISLKIKHKQKCDKFNMLTISKIRFETCRMDTHLKSF